MSKSQKVWLWVFTGMFLVPELVFQPVTNMIYAFFENSNNSRPLFNNFLFDRGPDFWYKGVLVFQAVGLISLILFLVRMKNENTLNFKLCITGIIFGSFFLIATLFVLFLMIFVHVEIL